MPLGRLWVPLLDSRWGWIVPAIIVLSPMMVFWPGWTGRMFESAVLATPRSWFWLFRLVVSLFLAVVLILLPATLAALFWFIYGARGWVGKRKRDLTERKRMCAVLALQDGSGPAGIERLVHDDPAYAERVGKFLQAHQYRCPVPLYDDAGRYRFRCETKARSAADSLVRAASRARDNELYVILADLAELGDDDLAPLVKAARLARARKHHVMFLLPWPAEVPSPDEAPPAPEAEAEPVDSDGRPWGPPKKKKRKRKVHTPADRVASLVPLVRESLTRQYHEQFRRVRRALGRVGATVLRVNEGDPVQLVLDRLDRLRGLRARR
jgi:hypothetical protein